MFKVSWGNGQRIEQIGKNGWLGKTRKSCLRAANREARDRNKPPAEVGNWEQG